MNINANIFYLIILGLLNFPSIQAYPTIALSELIQKYQENSLLFPKFIKGLRIEGLEIDSWSLFSKQLFPSQKDRDAIIKPLLPLIGHLLISNPNIIMDRTPEEKNFSKTFKGKSQILKSLSLNHQNFETYEPREDYSPPMKASVIEDDLFFSTLKSLPLTKLVIENCRNSKDNFISWMLKESFAPHSLEEIKFSKLGLSMHDSSTLEILSELTKFTRLNTLDLSENYLNFSHSSGQLEKLINDPQTMLQKLNLDHNLITEAGLKSLYVFIEKRVNKRSPTPFLEISFRGNKIETKKSKWLKKLLNLSDQHDFKVNF